MSDKSVIKLPTIPSEVTIAPDWIKARDELVEEVAGFEAIESAGDFDDAGELLRKITKTSNAMERFRKDMTAPLTEASRVVKKAADTAREPLEKAKNMIQQLLNRYAAEQDRRRREEQARIEAEQRKAIEAQIAKQEEDREIADELGLDLSDEPPPIPEVPAIIPQVEAARADGVRVQKNVVWEVADEGDIPRAFLILDPRKVNGYMAQHKDEIMKVLEEKPEHEGSFVPGLHFRIETKVISR